VSRIIRNFTFKTDFSGRGYEHNLYDVDVEDVELFQAKLMGNSYWELKVRGEEYNVAPASATLTNETQLKVQAILAGIKSQIDSAEQPTTKVTERSEK
jgi:hypothetical protein